MGWHCDSKFTLGDKFSEKMNGQKYNTPVIIFTIGKSCLLKWRKRFYKRKDNGYNSIDIVRDSIERMLLYEGSICIINPKDEEPHVEFNNENLVHFQHGDTKVKGKDISVAFVFRVSSHSCLCNSIDNKVILPEDILQIIREKEMNQKVNQTVRNEKYKEIDNNRYHQVLKSHFENNFFSKE